jgi:hypothetical protein
LMKRGVEKKVRTGGWPEAWIATQASATRR